jgi:endonuclease/exonuclease/phosphatase family metal-dependent hydrolase
VNRSLAMILGALSLLAAACGDGTPAERPVSVLTWNLYVGAELETLATVPSPQAVPDVTAKLWGDVQKSDFPARAKVLAARISELRPDFVALQEVSLYRKQTPSDFAPGAAPNATEVVLDFLATLKGELDARGGGYQIASEARNADVEVPVSDGAGGVFDLRVTDRDVILARDGVTATNARQTRFIAKLNFPVGGAGGIPLTFVRSVSHVDAELAPPAGAAAGAAPTRLVFGTSHLEIESLAVIQMAQAREVLAEADALTGPLLFAGDFNSAPGQSSYPLLTKTFRDLAAGLPAPATDFTCCQAPDLANPESSAGERIDLVLSRGAFRMKSARPVGTDPAADRTPAGQWASDHFGVYAELELAP